MPKKFVRQDVDRYSKLGKNRKKLQKWRKPKGRDSKMRLKRKSYPATVSIGYSSPKSDAGKINGKIPTLVHNVNEIKNLKKDSLAIIASVGAKKKMEIIKQAKESKIEILNVKEAKK